MSNGPTRVTTSITAKGWVTQIFSGETLLAERSAEMLSGGSARYTAKGDWFDVADACGFSDELADELESMNQFGIACELWSSANER